MSVRKSPRGKWMVHVKVKPAGQAPVEVRKVSPIQTKRGAEQYERDVKKAIMDGTWGKDLEDKAFGYLAEEYMSSYSLPHDEPNTNRWKQGIVNNHLLPRFKQVKLVDFEKPHLSQYVKERIQKVTTTTINKEVAVLLSMLRWAEEEGWRVTVPRYKKLKEPPADFDFLTEEEARALEQASTRWWDPWGVAVMLALDTGMRQSELRGLHWSSVDFRNRIITVRDKADNKNALRGTKSNKIRVIPMTSRLVDALKAHRHLRGDLVLCWQTGNVLDQSSMCDRMATMSKKAQLRPVGWHTLRHTFASWLVQKGANLLDVQKLMGHHSIEQTMIYAHLAPNSTTTAMSLLEPTQSRNEENHA